MNHLGFDKPTLLVNKTKCIANISQMVNKTREKNLLLRPHFKTHQNATIGKWFKDFGVDIIAVSSVPMAKYFSDNGWNDITISFPFVVEQAKNVNALAKKVKLQIVASSLQNAVSINNKITENVGVYIEIDTGHNRSGFNSSDTDSISNAVEILNSNNKIRFCGFLSHAGQTYGCKPQKVVEVHKKAVASLVFLKNLFIDDFPDITISFGDTPSSVIANDFEGIDELRPGNFVFFDMQQCSNGICDPSQIAAAVVCPVAAVYHEKNTAIIWGGAVHLSKDSFTMPNGKKSFGLVCKLRDDFTWTEPLSDLYVESISQEHGKIKAIKGEALNAINEGDLVAILPAHICLAVDCLGEIFIPGEGRTSCFNKRTD